MMKSLTAAVLAVATALSLSACQTASQHAADVRKAQTADDRISIGTVQREIRVGMSSSDVVEALGSPNMVTTDDKRRESWVYDKVSTEKVYSQSSGGPGVLFILLLSAEDSSGASSTTQRTLTIIIKFDEDQKVRDFAYRTSSF